MQTSSVSPSTNITAPEQKAKPNGSSDFETFLTLLTAQMRNQDPLKPMDSTAFVAQLASFSTVEQQIETNAKLDKILDNFGASPSSQLTEWIGKEVSRSETRPEPPAEAVFEMVAEARIEQGEVMLVLADGTKIQAHDVTSMRLPILGAT